MTRRAIAAALLALALATSSLASDGIEMEATPLFQPYYRAGRLLPVRVRIVSDRDHALSATIVIEQNAGGGLGYALVASQRVEIPPRSRRELVVHAAAPDPMGGFELSVVGRGGERLATQTLRSSPVEARERVIAVIGKEPVGLLGLAHADPAVHTVVLGDVWPTSWAQWLAIDMVVWPDPEPSSLGDTERDALLRWLAHGGVLVVATPRGALPLHGSFLAPLLPVEVATEIEVATLSGVDVAPLTRARFSRRGGSVAIGDDTDPVVVVAPYVMGRIAAVAFDLRATPFVRGDAALGFWASCLEQILPLPPEPDPDIVNRGYYGVGVAQQIDNTLAQMPGVQVAGVWWVTGLLAAYLLAIGPLDWWLQRRYRKRRFSWLFYPAFIVAFSSAILVATELQRRDGLTVRVVSIEDHKDGAVRGRAEVAVMREKSGRIDLENHGDHDLRLLRGRGNAGAMMGLTTANPLGRDLELDGGASALHTTVDAWQTALLEVGWVGELAGGIDVTWSDAGLTLQSGLASPLRSTLVVRGDRAWSFGLLVPGQVATSPRAGSSELVHEVRSAAPAHPERAEAPLDGLRGVLLQSTFPGAMRGTPEAGARLHSGHDDELATWLDLSRYHDCTIVVGFAEELPLPIAISGARDAQHLRFHRQIHCESRP